MSQPVDPHPTPAEWTPQPGETIRAKWTIDGAATLAEAADRFEEFAAELRRLHDQGWTLTEPVVDDYGFLVSPDGDAGNFDEGDGADEDSAPWPEVSPSSN